MVFLFNEPELMNIALIIANNISQSNMINYDDLNLRNIHKYVDHKYIEITRNIIQNGGRELLFNSI